MALNMDYVVKSGVDGATGTVRSRLFRKTATVDNHVNAGDALAAGTGYAAALLPAGFIPRFVVVNVLGKNAEAANLTVGIAAEDGTVSSAVGSSATFALNAEGATMKAVETPALQDGAKYVAVSADAAVDAEFEVVCVGDCAALSSAGRSL